MRFHVVRRIAITCAMLIVLRPIPAMAESPVSTRIAYDACTADLDLWAVVCGIYTFIDGDQSFVAYGVEPKWAPDGARIAFLAGDIMTVRLSDGLQTNVTNHPATYSSVTWASDATRLAFVSDRDGPTELYVIDGDGNNLRRLTFTSGFTGIYTWSPDANRIAYLRDASGIRELDVVNADGSNLMRLTSGDFGWLSWSSNGGRIAFGCATGICAYDFGSSTLIQLAPVWASDGVYAPGDDRIAVSAGDLGILSVDGTVAMISAGTPILKPVWSPDGKGLAFGGSDIIGYSGRCYFTPVHNADDFCVPMTGVYHVDADGAGLTAFALGGNPDWFKPGPGRPLSAFTAICNGTVCDFDATKSYDADGTIADYSWTFGDGSAAKGAMVHHTYPAGASYLVTLAITDNSGTTDVLRKAVAANKTPVASFSVTCSGPLCTFDGTASSDSDGTIASYYWNFGDGESSGSSSSSVVSHTYATGTFTAWLRVGDSGGAWARTSKTFDVVNQLPIASFTQTCAGLACAFDASASRDPDGSISAYYWQLGDGYAVYGSKVLLYTYPATGTFTVTLTVFDDARQSASQQKILITGNAAPVAAFTISCFGWTCTFLGSGSYDPDGTIQAYTWSFGDGSVASGSTVTHAYTTQATFRVVLTVTDNFGATNSAARDVPVSRAMHVGDLDGSGDKTSRGWTARATVTVHDAFHQPAAASVTVVGSWGAGPSVSCVTVNGQCTLSTLVTSRSATSIAFSVKTLTQDVLVYEPTANHDADADSNGTTIVVLKPGS